MSNLKQSAYQLLQTNRLTLADALRSPVMATVDKTTIFIKKEVPDEWGRVLQMRKDNDPLIFGGKNSNPNFKPVYVRDGIQSRYDPESHERSGDRHHYSN